MDSTASAINVQLLAKVEGQTDYQPLVLEDKKLLAHAPVDGGNVSLPFSVRYFRLTQWTIEWHR